MATTMIETYLTAIDGQEDISLDRAVMVIGRDHACDARIDSDRVSRLHCFLVRGGDEVVVRDLGSKNGTRVNGLRVETGLLRSGDELSIAGLRYRYSPEAVCPRDAYGTRISDGEAILQQFGA